MNTNKDIHEKLSKEGKLESNLKNGKPKTIPQKILALGYPIIVLIMLIGTVITLIKNKHKMRWNVFIPHMIIGSVCGWMWGIYMEKFDPEYPAWLFHPWAIIGPEWFITLEDWLFYPVCGAMFYVIYRLLKYDPSKTKEWTKWAFQIFHIAITLFFIYFTAPCGKSIAFQFAVVPIFLFFYTWNKWDTSHYIKLLIFVVVFAAVWDWAAVSWIHYIPGFAWASQWVYVSFDAMGNPHHSSVFLSYTNCRWAWIFDNPIEITPWFGIAGAMFTYSLALSLDKFVENIKR